MYYLKVSISKYFQILLLDFSVFKFKPKYLSIKISLNVAKEIVSTIRCYCFGSSYFKWRITCRFWWGFWRLILIRRRRSLIRWGAIWLIRLRLRLKCGVLRREWFWRSRSSRRVSYLEKRWCIQFRWKFQVKYLRFIYSW